MGEKVEGKEYLYSPTVRRTGTATFALSTNLTWDAFVRLSYQRATEALQAQANELVRRGNISASEARALVESQRNALVRALRNRLSPFGRTYSEILKPTKDLPTLERLLKQKGSLEAVLTSVGKSRGAVNRLAVAVRVAGPGTIALQIGMSVVVVAAASPDERARVASGQGGALAGAALAGWAGAWAGCAGLSALTSPSLVVPVVGEVTTAGACVIGGIAGGFGAGWVGALLGQWGGEASYDFITTDLTWSKR